MKEAKSYARTRGWLSLVEGFGWLVLVLGFLTVGAILFGGEGSIFSMEDRLVWAIIILLAFVSSAAVTISTARIGHAVCDIAENTAAGNRRADRTPGRRDPVISRAPLSPLPGGDEADTD